ncbi:PREDICTED: putative pentatricopeptide repeat-containing protein At1g77010, mitochondrial [Camelina sativa]|uniref:Pentatricopeptide repeat-containing protein At1g77010, mitochondrial n=1 Tax=Camelina sativa TaxID=90675 RepID=A0ABM1Q7E8_CAMSA|nr:PREDICTED: putative pentatricopeptide repeat-containing protein At1g77010, mitochondrial [Camelina sativa]
MTGLIFLRTMEVECRRYYVRLLQSCSNRNRETLWRQTHGLFLKKGFISSIVIVANHLLQIYSRSGNMGTARNLFDEMPERNYFSWNTMIEGYINSGEKGTSLRFFDTMPERDGYSWNLVVSGFAKAGELGVARRLFNAMPVKDAVTLNSLLHGYILNGYAEEALRLFKELKFSGDAIIMTTVLKACAMLEALKSGKQIHARIMISGAEFDSKMNSSLVNLYAKCGEWRMASVMMDQIGEPDDHSLSALVSGYANCGRVNESRRVFDRKSDRCVILWNSMISGYVANNMKLEALVLYNEMRKETREDSRTLAAVINACIGLGFLETGKQMHCHACKFGLINDVVVASTLLDMYSKCGSPMEACKIFSEVETYDTILLNNMINVYFSCGRFDDAKRVFERIENKSLISWNSMINGFSQNGCPVETLEYFRRMHKLDLPTDEVSLSSVISACASISSLELGEQVFARATIVGLDPDQVVSSSLVDLYCKCGFVEHGRSVFDTMVKTDEVSWNSMISGYATNGLGFEAIDLFKKMNVAGIKPTRITFMVVLTAYNYCGLVEEGRKFFEAMKLDHGFFPDKEHFSCMVDLLARAGYVKEALNLVEEMPFEADASMWSSVLRGCVANGHKSMGKKVAEKIIELEPENSVAYVQLSAIFATSGDWESSGLVRKLMREKNVTKNPGSSWADC